jgi:hypothetical protein
MSIDPAEQLVICVNGSEEMKRNEAAIGGQLWIQGERQMTASNMVLEGMTNSRESAILSATVEAITWTHALETDGPRKGQRIVIYPKEISQLETVLSTEDPNVDPEDGHPIAYTKLLQAAQSFEHPPIFLKEDSEHITQDPVMEEKVPVWMNTAAQVATGNRKMVLEDSPDVMNSDDDDALEDVKPDEEKGMYTSGMDPNQGPVKLTPAQVAAQKAAAQALKALNVPPRSQSPVGGSSDDDEPTGSEWVWSQTKGCMRRNKFFRDRASTTGTKVETKSAPCPPTKSERPPPVATVSVPLDTLPDLEKGKGTKRPRVVTQPKEEQKSSKPMETRGQASRAGGLRPVGGSWQKDTRVAKGNPSKT